MGRLRGLAVAHPRWGYRQIQRVLRREGHTASLNRVYRLYRAEGLAMKRRRPKRVRRGERCPLPQVTGPGQRWSMDFVHDQLDSGRRIRLLNIVDDFTRECVHSHAAHSISGHDVARVLDGLSRTRGLPKVITCDNGTEFTSKALAAWRARHDVRLNFIEPGKPMQNAFVESFNGRMRDDFLNQNIFFSVDDLRGQLIVWRRHYNEWRPHSALKGMTPAEFASHHVQTMAQAAA